MAEEEIEQRNEANGGLSVLVVDDSSVARAMIIKTLRMTGLPLSEVREAPNGKEALEAIGEHWIDLILADINMPVMNGDEMIERLQANSTWPPVPIVVVSTDGSQPLIEKLLAHGVRYLRKPFTPEMLHETIVEALETSNV